MNSSGESLFHLADTYESLSEITGISFKKWFYYKARVKTFCELVYARKLVKARELQFLGGSPSWSQKINLHVRGGQTFMFEMINFELIYSV